MKKKSNHSFNSKDVSKDVLKEKSKKRVKN